MRTLLRDQLVSVRYKDQQFDQIILGLRQERLPTQATLLAFTGMPKLQMEMAAKELAASLDLTLYRIDMQTVLNKYIGETEKNLQHVFGIASAARRILFFDDGDALFGERTNAQDVHYRYNSSETNCLLEILAKHRGTVIALFQSISAAERRMNSVRHLVVKFPPF